MRFSIRYKILLVLAILLITAVGFYTALASQIFVEQKTALLYDINHSIAVNTASQLRARLSQTGDKLNLFALSRILTEQSQWRLKEDFLRTSNILGARLFRVDRNGYLEIKMTEGLPPVGAAPTDWVPYLREAASTGHAFWSQTAATEPGYYLASQMDVNSAQGKRSYVVVGRIDGKPLFETVQAANLFFSYLVKPGGEVLFHCDRTDILPSPPVSDHPLVASLKTTGASSGVLAFDYKEASWYGAFAPVGIGNLYFLSQADSSEVASALTTLMKRSALYGLIVVTVTFIFTILFSKGLTRNIRELTDGVRRIEEGNLESNIRIRSGDEVETLAHQFNRMVEAVRESRQALEQYNEELEEKVAERTVELQKSNAAIKEVQEKLVTSSQLAAVGEVAGRTAHELLNPLTAIISRLERDKSMVTAGETQGASLPAQLLQILRAWETDYAKGGLPHLTQSLSVPSKVIPEATLFDEDLKNLRTLADFWDKESTTLQEDIDFVHEQARRIHRIIDKMRELVRSSVKEEVHCHDAVKEAALTMTDFLSKKGVRLTYRFDAADDTAVLNRDELIQVITNLIRNSFQAVEAQSDGRQGEIQVLTGSKAGTFWVDIIDNGIGIPEDKQGMIFDQGFTTKGPSEGTGLGLAICRRYARAFGGEIRLNYSRPGEGTCFRILVPLKAASREAA